MGEGIERNVGRSARRITAQAAELDLRILDSKSEKPRNILEGAAARFRRMRRALKILIPNPVQRPLAVSLPRPT
jgi:hypothetical protein